MCESRSPPGYPIKQTPFPKRRAFCRLPPQKTILQKNKTRGEFGIRYTLSFCFIHPVPPFLTFEPVEAILGGAGNSREFIPFLNQTFAFKNDSDLFVMAKPLPFR